MLKKLILSYAIFFIFKSYAISPVFEILEECQAVAANLKSGQSSSMVMSICHSNDCLALITNNQGLCDSTDCRCILNINNEYNLELKKFILNKGYCGASSYYARDLALSLVNPNFQLEVDEEEASRNVYAIAQRNPSLCTGQSYKEALKEAEKNEKVNKNQVNGFIKSMPKERHCIIQ